MDILPHGISTHTFTYVHNKNKNYKLKYYRLGGYTVTLITT